MNSFFLFNLDVVVQFQIKPFGPKYSPSFLAFSLFSVRLSGISPNPLGASERRKDGGDHRLAAEGDGMGGSEGVVHQLVKYVRGANGDRQRRRRGGAVGGRCRRRRRRRRWCSWSARRRGGGRRPQESPAAPGVVAAGLQLLDMLM